MVVKSRLKFINGLQLKKNRAQQGLFVAEGVKLVTELLASAYKVDKIYATTKDILPNNTSVELVTSHELAKMSGLKNPNKVLGVFHIPAADTVPKDDWLVALDNVRDPGNLGTILRLCDWFGISSLVCSKNTVDCYNPKVLQASMGSIARVKICYTDLERFFTDTSLPIYTTGMEGASVYGITMPKKGILVMGNEGQGVSKLLETMSSKQISIPQFAENTAESLNVAMATAILLNEIRRK